MKKIIAILAALFVPSIAHAFSTVRYVQISTNTLSQQSGGFNVSSGTIGTQLTVSTITGVSGTMSGFNTITVTTITPTHVVGTTTNDNATVGTYGEYVSSTTSGVSSFPTNGNYGDLLSISLTAGDWDVTGTIQAQINGATWTNALIAISTTTGNSSAGITEGVNGFRPDTTNITSNALLAIPAVRESLSTTTTIYLKYRSSYSAGGPPQAIGRISARRVR